MFNINSIPYGQSSAKIPVILSPSHLVIWSFSHLIIQSFDHSVIWSFDHLIIWSFSHLVIWSLESFGHAVIWSCGYTALWWSTQNWFPSLQQWAWAWFPVSWRARCRDQSVMPASSPPGARPASTKNSQDQPEYEMWSCQRMWVLLNVAMIQCREIITPQSGAYVYVLYHLFCWNFYMLLLILT